MNYLVTLKSEDSKPVDNTVEKKHSVGQVMLYFSSHSKSFPGTSSCFLLSYVPSNTHTSPPGFGRRFKLVLTPCNEEGEAKCYICLGGGSDEATITGDDLPLRRDCSCRGSAMRDLSTSRALLTTRHERLQAMG